MLFIAIERFRDNDMVPVYAHLEERGRGLPDGLEFLGSWVAADFSRCFQLMRCERAELLQEWVLHWRGLGATIEVVPVIEGAETHALIKRLGLVPESQQ